MKHFLLSFILALTALAMQAQSTRAVTGHVTDEHGEPLIGANVRVDGSSTVTATDINGDYKIQVPTDKSASLVISYVGYRQKKIAIEAGKSKYDTRMDINDNTFEEVVVIGYGTAKKSALTSSVEMVKGDDIARIPVMNVDEGLAGQLSGLGVVSTSGDPSTGKEATIHVRGNTNPPLLVIDGVPRFSSDTNGGEMRLSDLNPDDIESISVLKDAAAAAVYGVRAANGVILVQTKRGKSEGRTRVNYRGQFNFQQATYLPKFLDAYRFAELYNRAVENTGSDIYKPYDLSLLKSNPNLYADEDMLDYLNNWGHSQRHTVSVQGGIKSVRYFVSGGYTDTKGLYSNMGRDRFNYSAKIDADLIKGLTLSVDVTGSVSENKNTSYTTIQSAYDYSPLQVLRFTDGNLASINGGNPLISVYGLGGYIKQKTNNLTLNAVLRYNIPKVDGLQVYLKGTMDMNSQDKTEFDKPVTLYLYDEETNTTSIDANTVYPKAKVKLDNRTQSIDNKLIELGISYDHTFAKRHAVTGLLVANYQDYHNKYLRGAANNLPGTIPEVIGTTTDGTIYGNEYYNERASLVGRATYGFDNRYFAEFSFRVDGSTKFSPENRWGFFPTLSASWVISNEKFFKAVPASIMSLAKLRASGGILGDDGSLSDYSYLMNYVFTTNQGYPIGGNMSPGIMIDPNSYPNENLKWGKSVDYNVGLDLGFWNNRFTATVEWFRRTRTNMVTSAPTYLYPPSVGTGGNVPSVNFGKVLYTGWDFTLKHVNTVGDFKYDVSFNLSKAWDKVLDYGDESSVVPNQRRKGGSFLAWSMYEAAGIFQSYEEIASWPVDQDGNGNASLAPGDIKYLDKDGNNVLTTNDKIWVRNSSFPQVSYGIGLGASWKGIYLNVLFQGVAGYNQRINELYTLENGSLQRFQEYHYTDTWTPENPDAKYPRVKFASKNDNNRLESTFWVRDCDFMRLKSLTIGYRFPAKLLRKARISSLDIALQGSNLFTVSSLDNNMDPESLDGYPLSRTYGISLNFGF